MNRVKLGVFSLSAASETGQDQAYLAWHQMDHMPEQYQIPGVVNAQRWVSTPACRAARAAGADGADGLADVEHVVSYLIGDPVEQSIEDFFELGRRLSGLGRLPVLLPSRLLAGLHFLEAQAAPAAMVSDEVVPWRPNRGVYLVVEEVLDPAALAEAMEDRRTGLLPAVVSVRGVAGAWMFGTTGLYRDARFSSDRLRVTVCYLDGEPAEVAPELGVLWRRQWTDGAPLRPLLAAPFESIAVADWQRFAAQPVTERGR